MGASPNTYAGLTGREWGAVGLTGAAGLAGLFSGGDKSLDQIISQLNSQVSKANASSSELAGEGSAALQPVESYLKDITSGNRQAVLAATMPERQRILDQYDTAKRAITEFAPRGGGQASSMSRLLTSEASDLATTTANARQQGFSQAASLGTALRQLGISEDQIATQGLSSVLQAALEKSKNDQQKGFSLGSALGSAASIVLGFL